MKQVELLAPAGNYETMLGAFNAGADAVYLGGQGFGARAFADNFTNEEVVAAIKYAHLYGKKIYLTVNTLLKEKEIPAFKEFFAPFAYAGLDAAIIQDLGIFKIIRENFPWVELHVSTQMTITGPYGAAMLKKLGASRVVPARELTLDELKGIHDYCLQIDDKGIELETFIHGAMCYCYSGACLFSSMIGERSGNRGRCAQPCRLPYKLNGHGKECYPLSLKDMCLVDNIPKLIEAGIDSFKIEGRMKKAEYAAGVTSVYRKYIDKYYEQREKGVEGDIVLTSSDADKKILSGLYLRSQIGEGYYFKHNGADMVTLDNPSYNGSDENVINDINAKYIEKKLRIPVSMYCALKIDEPAMIKIETVINGAKICAEVTGNVVQRASNRPMLFDDCKKQLTKLGNSEFELENFELDIDSEGVFIPVKALNELRRNACEALENEIAKFYGYKGIQQEANAGDNSTGTSATNSEKRVKYEPSKLKSQLHAPKLCVSVMTKAQLEVVLEENSNRSNIDRIYVDSRIVINSGNLPVSNRAEIIVALPYVTRAEKNIPDRYDLKRIFDIIDENGYDGILVRNLEELSFAIGQGFTGKIIPDYGLYLWNDEAYSMYMEILKSQGFNEFNLPLELTSKEMDDTLYGIYSGILSDEKREKLKFPTAGLMLYGRVPMMHSANCIRNTFKDCTGNRGKDCSYDTIFINDRTGRTIPVTYDCRYCTNIIWNSVPVSLFKKYNKISALADRYNLAYRLDFTLEKKDQVSDVLRAYEDIIFGESRGNDSSFVSKLSAMEYTTGHFERSAD